MGSVGTEPWSLPSSVKECGRERERSGEANDQRLGVVMTSIPAIFQFKADVVVWGYNNNMFYMISLWDFISNNHCTQTV